MRSVEKQRPTCWCWRVVVNQRQVSRLSLTLQHCASQYSSVWCTLQGPATTVLACHCETAILPTMYINHSLTTGLMYNNSVCEFVSLFAYKSGMSGNSMVYSSANSLEGGGAGHNKNCVLCPWQLASEVKINFCCFRCVT